jgi:hypothetical protein
MSEKRANFYCYNYDTEEYILHTCPVIKIATIEEWYKMLEDLKITTAWKLRFRSYARYYLWWASYPREGIHFFLSHFNITHFPLQNQDIICCIEADIKI